MGSPSRAIALAALVAATPAFAQSSTGSVSGQVFESGTGAPFPAVTVTATSPALQQPQTELTDASGHYSIENLPSGTYTLVYLAGDAVVRRENVIISVGKTTTVNASIAPGTEVVTIKERTPTIDTGSSKLGLSLMQDQLRNVPARGRTYEAVLGNAAGAQTDLVGVAFSGSTSPENSYLVDGLNTTGLTFGGVSSPVINNFIQEIEVITGGYNAEYGRSTGAVVNVVTKTGSNDFHGSVWANVTPFEATRKPVSVSGSALSERDSLNFEGDFGFDIGGPIVKDHVWFYLGFAPVLTRTNIARIASTRVDRGRAGFNYHEPNCPKNDDGTCDGDGNPATTAAPQCELRGNCESDGIADVDPATGFEKFEEIDRRNWLAREDQYQLTGKLNFALSPDHQGQVSFIGSPSAEVRTYGVAGTETAMQQKIDTMTTDLAAKWTSKFNDNKTQIDIVFGWHRQKFDGHSVNPTLPGDPTRSSDSTPATAVFRVDDSVSNLGVLGHNRDVAESERTLAFCDDASPSDQFRQIVNCPVAQYWMSSFGSVRDNTENATPAKRRSRSACARSGITSSRPASTSSRTSSTCCATSPAAS